MRGPAFFAYADNYLIDVKFGVIMDVEASRAIRQAEVGAAKTMIERTEQRFGLKPERLAADTAYGSAANLNWIVNERKIAPHIPVIDKSKREDGSLSRDDFTFDKDRNVYVCPQGNLLHTTGTIHDGETILCRAKTYDCGPCPLKPQCCPKAPERKIPRSIYEDARDVARALADTPAFDRSRRDRKRVEMLFAHLKRILRLGRLRLRGPRGAQDEFTLAAIAQNLRRLGKLVARPPPASTACVAQALRALSASASKPPLPQGCTATKGLKKNASAHLATLIADFCNKIGTSRKCRPSSLTAAYGSKADSCIPSIDVFMSSRPSSATVVAMSACNSVAISEPPRPSGLTP